MCWLKHGALAAASILAALIFAASQGFPTRLAEPDPTPDVVRRRAPRHRRPPIGRLAPAPHAEGITHD
jgi:hypothetical protein